MTELKSKDEKEILLETNDVSHALDVKPSKDTTIEEKRDAYTLAPHEQIALHWTDITLEIIQKGKSKKDRCFELCSCTKDKSKISDHEQEEELKGNIPILRGISGHAKPGELYAIMGASGGGKTTLLSILTGRIRSISSLSSNSISTGTVRLNNITIDCNKNDELNYLLKNIKFVMQHDVLFETEKCGEVVKVSQVLRLNKPDFTEKQKLNLYEFIMSSLDIKKCDNTYIGGEAVRGLSGGERTRTSIGIEVITNPKILVLDEPTSGLDSASAFKTMSLLKMLANLGRTVVVCIHQPSTAILKQIDRVMILAKGKVTFEGYVANELPKYLKSINYECPPHTNIADHFIDHLNKNPQYFIDAWIKYEKNNGDDSKLKLSQQTSSATTINEISAPKMIPYCYQFGVVTKRFCKIFMRNKGSSISRILTIIVQALVLGLIWMRLTPIEDVEPAEDQPEDAAVDVNVLTNLQDKFGGIFMAVIFTSLNQVSAAVIDFPGQRLQFEKERSCRWYYTSVYAFAKMLIILPFAALLIIIFSLITKWFVGFQMSFGEYFLGLLLIDYACDAYSYFLGSFAPNPSRASQLMPVLTNLFILFSGVFIAIDSIPEWLRWIRYINPYYYGIEFLAIAEFEGATNNGNEVGDLFLNSMDFDVDNKWMDIIIIACLFVFVRICSVISLMIRYSW